MSAQMSAQISLLHKLPLKRRRKKSMLSLERGSIRRWLGIQLTDERDQLDVTVHCAHPIITLLIPALCRGYARCSEVRWQIIFCRGAVA